MQGDNSAAAILEAFDCSGDGLAVWDASDNLIDFNHNYNEMFKLNMHMPASKGLNFKLAYEKSLQSGEAIVRKTDFEKRLKLREKARLENRCYNCGSKDHLSNDPNCPWKLLDSPVTDSGGAKELTALRKEVHRIKSSLSTKSDKGSTLADSAMTEDDG